MTADMDDFGRMLRQAREQRGISLRQIAANTRIPVAALEAVERNDISKWPGGIFSRGFVRSYAVAVGLDPEQTVHEFLARFNQAPPPSSTPARSMAEEDSQFESRQRAAVFTIRLALIAIPIFVVVLYLAFRGRHVSTPHAAAPAVQTAPIHSAGAGAGRQAPGR
ncbi:MAG: helix-turn-helix domain-containing protein [Vicinamibacterales bacterium]